MQFDLNFGNMVALGSVFVGALWALVKIIGKQQETHLNQRFEIMAKGMAAMVTSIDRDREATRQLERQLMELKAELPRDYVRREDFIRAVATIETKIDNMALRLERALLSRGSEQ